MPNHIVWKRDSNDFKQESLETTSTMGAFARDNYDSISLINKEFEEKEQELQRSKQEQAQENAQHQHELQDLKNEYEEKLKQIQEHNDLLKKQLEEAKGVNDEHTQNISTL